MGKMKELFIAMRDGDIEDLRIDYKQAEDSDRDTVSWQGKVISLQHAQYLLEFSDTFLKTLTNDNIRNTDNEPQQLL